ncbi:MAG: hypothetical protein NXI00_23050, partial [Cytophagales bacterium]|nr:hypothetical protein [Cytophagales bacterium]
NSDFSASKLRVLKDELKEHNTFESVTCSGHVPSTGFNWRGGVRKLGKAQDQQSDVTVIFVDNEFNSTYDFDFMSGSPFAATMSSHKDGVIINEEAVNMLELGSPEKALEEKLIISAINDTVKIIGVIENFHWSSLKQPNSPYLFAINPYICSYVSSRVTKGGIQESVDHLEETYLSLFPGEPFDYFFLNKEFEKQYKSEVQFGDLLTSFSLLSVIITCLGLFALVTFSTAQRRKEISVRKVHGASLSGLMFLLVREYVILLIIASAISLPVVFYFGQSWMENFAFRKGFDLGVFVFPVLTLAAISFVTILRQILSLARINPTEALRND